MWVLKIISYGPLNDALLSDVQLKTFPDSHYFVKPGVMTQWSINKVHNNKTGDNFCLHCINCKYSVIVILF